MDIYVGASARVGQPTRLQRLRRRVSGALQTGARPYIRWWMSDDRETSVQGVDLRVPVGVFPPRLFHSTKLVCRTVDRMDLAGKSFLEVGCGSGAISVVAARRRAMVTAIDISDAACAATRANATSNGVPMEVVESDLFSQVQGRFDMVVITPPFFRHDPSTQLDHAFHAGANFEYFHRLFEQLPDHLHDDSLVLLSLAEGCDAAIGEIARECGFELQIHRRWMVMLQFTYVFRVVRP